MIPSHMTPEQHALRQQVIDTLRPLGWSGPREQAMFDADLIVDPELTMTRRIQQRLLMLKLSIEHDYLGLLVSEKARGLADDLGDHAGSADALGLLSRLLEHTETFTFATSVLLFSTLSAERPGDVFFFDGADVTLLTPENIRSVIQGHPMNHS